jgi:hypothetical protein
LGEAVDQDAAGIILEDAGDVLGGFEADRFDEGVVCFRKLEAVVDILVTVKLSDINDLILKQLEGEFEGGIDEDSDPQDGTFEIAQKFGGVLGGAVALGFGPKVDPKSVHADVGELLRIVSGGDSADFQRGRFRVEELVEMLTHRTVIKRRGGRWQVPEWISCKDLPLGPKEARILGWK